jgi:hypothetical protein
LMAGQPAASQPASRNPVFGILNGTSKTESYGGRQIDVWMLAEGPSGAEGPQGAPTGLGRPRALGPWGLLWIFHPFPGFFTLNGTNHMFRCNLVFMALRLAVHNLCIYLLCGLTPESAEASIVLAATLLRGTYRGLLVDFWSNCQVPWLSVPSILSFFHKRSVLIVYFPPQSSFNGSLLSCA